MNSDNEFGDLDLDNLPGICDKDYQNTKNSNEFLIEDKIPFCPRISEHPLNSNQIKNLINEEINYNKKTPKEDEIFTFKNNKENVNINNKIKNLKKNNEKFNTEISDKFDKKKIKANVVNFEDLVKNANDKKTNNKKVKIDFSRKLYQNKKRFDEGGEIKKEKIIKDRSIKNIRDLSYNKSEKFINSKRSEIKINKSPNKISKKSIINNNNNNKKEDNKILFNYFKLDSSSKKKEKISMKYKDKNIIFNFDNPEERNNKSFVLENNMSRDNSLIMNKTNRSIKSKHNANKLNIMNEMNNKIKSALDNKKTNRRYTNIKDDLINFDNSKFEKYDTEQYRYGLIKDYSFIHPEKSENFLERMEFDYYKRKNKEKKIDEFVQKNKNKYKLNESERKKTFNRLNEDANRRIIIKQEILENEKYLTEFREEFDRGKKYSKVDWDRIYKKRFKQYEDIKKKKIDIQRQNEKIKKMIKEEEEINMCKIKKIPMKKIQENTERLYNDAKKREILKNNKNLISDKSARNFNFYKNNICLTNYDIEEDASKYMKKLKGDEYYFHNDKSNNLKINNSRIKMNKNLNRSFDRKSIKKTSKISVTEFNNMRFEKNNIIKYPKKNINKKIPFNFNLNFKNNIEPYFQFKKNLKQNTLSQNEYSPTFTMPCEYNYNNYNIYNINNLNNNINTNPNRNINSDINNEDDYLTNITNQLLQSAALKKIESGYLNNNQIMNDKNNTEQYNGLSDFLFGQKIQNNKNSYDNINDNINNNINNNIIYNNQNDEKNQLIEEFLSSNFKI